MFRLSPDGSGGYTETVLHAFQGGSDGREPVSGLVQDASGTLYGTTLYGGDAACPTGCGTVFSVTATGTETLLHAFQGGLDGAEPACTLIPATDGSFYGVTTRGGTVAVVNGRPTAPMTAGAGTFFQLSPAGAGYANSVKVRFVHEDGIGLGQPVQITLGTDGKFYGVTVRSTYWGSYAGGDNDGVFIVDPTKTHGQEWFSRPLFQGSDTSGFYTNYYGRLLRDTKGNLFGTVQTSNNEQTIGGAVYQLSPSKGMGGPTPWDFQPIWQFPQRGTREGGFPVGGLLAGAPGTFYGTTTEGGLNTIGNVYELFKTRDGYKQRVLWRFRGAPDGATPYGALIADGSGNLYGTTAAGGQYNLGTVFRVTP